MVLLAGKKLARLESLMIIYTGRCAGPLNQLLQPDRNVAGDMLSIESTVERHASAAVTNTSMDEHRTLSYYASHGTNALNREPFVRFKS